MAVGTTGPKPRTDMLYHWFLMPIIATENFVYSNNKIKLALLSCVCFS